MLTVVPMCQCMILFGAVIHTMAIVMSWFFDSNTYNIKFRQVGLREMAATSMSILRKLKLALF